MRSGVRTAAAATLCAAVAIAAAASRPFTFAVLGDRTGSARPAVFRQILAEMALLHPDFIVCTGDLIQGDAGDAAATNAQWDTIIAQLKSTGIPYHIAPGNHDITSPSSESVFTRRVGRPFHTLKYGNSTFLFVDNTRWRVAESLPRAELRWLDKELAQARKSRHTFVLMHRPYWRDALDKGRPELLHSKFKAAGVDYVFTGHDHFYCSHTWDGIHYFQVGPSGSRLKVYDDPGAGGFQNYLLCRVSGDTVTVDVRAPGRSDPLPVDTVTWTDTRALDEALRKAVKVPAAERIGSDRDWTVSVTLRNVTDRVLNGELAWNDSLTSWHVIPRSMSYTIVPDGRLTQEFRLELSDPDSIYPVPRFSLPYEYRPGRRSDLGRRPQLRRAVTALRMSSRPVIDGRLNDACWRGAATLTGFGADNGDASPLPETRVWVGFDDSMLYVGAHCRESLGGGIVAAVRASDGRIADDDNLSLLLMPEPPLARRDSQTYYQVSINPLGNFADRRCRFRKGRNASDYSWNGNWNVAGSQGRDGWTVEMSCRLADLGADGGNTWSINACRFQARTKRIAVWQAPFEHEPDALGLLRAPD